MNTNLDVWQEDQCIRSDPMDEEYEMMHDDKKPHHCEQCSELSWIPMLYGICDSCIDDNFEKEYKDVERYSSDEYEGSWVHRRNCIAQKYGMGYDYFKWCPNCNEPKSWMHAFEPIGYDPNDDQMMIWDYEHREVNYCFECHVKGTYVEVVDYD